MVNRILTNSVSELKMTFYFGGGGGGGSINNSSHLFLKTRSLIEKVRYCVV